MDPDEPFNPEYYHFVLQSLTLNSRAIITELSTIAERFPEHAEEIVGLIEERIRKCLPQQKLFSIYLLDSICKNVGNPYNLFFGTRLYKIFTESYLVVTDTPTRQDLINLFKTWQGAKTTAGADLFPESVIQKIEKFIIRATSIGQTPEPQHQSMFGPQGQNGGGQLQNSSQNHSQKYPTLSGPIPSPDSLLREANLLLQTIVALNNSYDEFLKTRSEADLQSINETKDSEEVDKENGINDRDHKNHKIDGFKFGNGFNDDNDNDKNERNRIDSDRQICQYQLEHLEQQRNTAVMNLNVITDSIYLANKQHYATIAGKLLNDLKDIRAQLDEQTLKQQDIIRSLEPIAKIELEAPNGTFFANWTLDIVQDSSVMEFLQDWGKEVIKKEVSARKNYVGKDTINSIDLVDDTPINIADIDLDSPMMERLVLALNLGSEVSSATEIDTDEDDDEEDEELYDPMINFDSDPEEIEAPIVPKSFLFDDTPREPLVSSLKKRRGSTDQGHVVKKKVRFADEIGT